MKIRNWTYWNAAVALLHTQLYTAVQVDITSTARELECSEREVVGCSQPIALHLHRLVSGIWTAAQKHESKYDREN